MACSRILELHTTEWQPALRHPFLTAVGSGDIAAAAFNQWLLQDRQFVIRFRDLAEHLLSRAPAPDQELLRGGLAALDDELRWFKEKVAERQLKADVPLHAVTAEYCDFMQQLQGQPYAVLATAFWAIEYAYNKGWAGLGAVQGRYSEFAERWGSREFSAYVDALQSQADVALAAADEAVQLTAEQAVGVAIPRLEVLFWQMALTP